jgi:hypothetical protein
MSAAVRIVAAFALSVTFLMGCNPTGSAEATVDRWLSALSDASGDRGWHLLSEWSQERYGSNQRAYEDDAAAVDWTQVEWSVWESYEDDGLATVLVEVQGAWEGTPEFLRTHGLVSIWCPDRGFIVYVPAPWVGDIGPGARVGATTC